MNIMLPKVDVAFKLKLVDWLRFMGAGGEEEMSLRGASADQRSGTVSLALL
jgi:hypothetical protein